MSNYNDLKIGADKTITIEKWDELIEKIEELELKIPSNENGEILNGLSVGSKPSTPEEGVTIDYPWEYETLGVSNKIFNLRLQSPKGIYFHTNITNNEGTDTSKWWHKVSLAIKQDGNVGIGTNTPKSKLEVAGNIIASSVSASNFRVPYLEPGHKSSTYEYIRLGTKDSYFGGLMHNKKASSFGNGNDFTIFSYSGRNINIRPDGNGSTNIIRGNLGIGIENPSTKLHVKGTTTIHSNASVLKLAGTDHCYIEFYKTSWALQGGSSRRQGYLGYPSKTDNDLTIYNKISNGAIDLRASKIQFKGSTIHGSDKKLKKNIQYIKGMDVLEKLGSINLAKYNYKTDKQNTPPKIGLIAQDIKNIFPDAVHEVIKGKEDKTLYVDYQYINMIAIQSIKELKSEIENLKKFLVNRTSLQ